MRLPLNNIRSKILDTIHTISHPGIKNMSGLERGRMREIGHVTAELVKKAKECDTLSTSTDFPVLNTRFDHVHLDRTDSFPPCQTYYYLLTCIDRCTRCHEAVPITDMSVQNIVQAIVMGWVDKFGTPFHYHYRKWKTI